MLLDAGLTSQSRPWRDIVSRAETRAKLLEGG